MYIYIYTHKPPLRAAPSLHSLLDRAVPVDGMLRKVQTASRLRIYTHVPPMYPYIPLHIHAYTCTSTHTPMYAYVIIPTIVNR